MRDLCTWRKRLQTKAVTWRVSGNKAAQGWQSLWLESKAGAQEKNMRQDPEQVLKPTGHYKEGQVTAWSSVSPASKMLKISTIASCRRRNRGSEKEGPLSQTHTFVIKRFVEFWG